MTQSVAVFAGPTISADQVREIVPWAQVHPPLLRGDLLRLAGSPPDVTLVVDGIFSGTSSPPVSEFHDFASCAEIRGAASLGAVRAVECAPSGMLGAGAIYRLFRIGALVSDAEVAVSVNPLRGFRAETLALVDLRHFVSALRRAGVIDDGRRATIIDALSDIHFLERTTEAVSAVLGNLVLPPYLLVESIADRGPKKMDAVRALRMLRNGRRQSIHDPRNGPVGRRHVVRNGSSALTAPLDHLERPEFALWILGSGLYQKYLWPILLRSGLSKLDGSRVDPYALRGWAAGAFNALVRDADTFVRFLLEEMDFLDDVTAETVVWRASKRAAGRYKPRAADIEYAREEIAVRHGFENWAELIADSVGMVHNAIPVAVVARAVEVRAAAICAAAKL